MNERRVLSPFGNFLGLWSYNHSQYEQINDSEELDIKSVLKWLGLNADCKLAIDRLCALIANIDEQSKADCDRLNRLEHYRLERGGAVRVYEGMDFVLRGDS